jgi:hypothetical protein
MRQVTRRQISIPEKYKKKLNTLVKSPVVEEAVVLYVVLLQKTYQGLCRLASGARGGGRGECRRRR